MRYQGGLREVQEAKRGRVVRGSDRRLRFLEERLPGDWTPEGVGLLKTWPAELLGDATAIKELSAKAPLPPVRRAKGRAQSIDLSNDLELATAAPESPPPTWKRGPKAWAAAVQSARKRLSGRAGRRKPARADKARKAG